MERPSSRFVLAGSAARVWLVYLGPAWVSSANQAESDTARCLMGVVQPLMILRDGCLRSPDAGVVTRSLGAKQLVGEA